MKKNNRRGIALIEALAALAILSGGVLAAFQSFRVATRSAAASRERLHAAYMLEGRMWELANTPKRADVWESLEDTPLGAARFTSEKAPLADDDTIEAWTLTLAWGGEGEKEKTLSLSAYFPADKPKAP